MRGSLLALLVVLALFTACAKKTDEEAFDEIQKKLTAATELTTVPANVQTTSPYIKGKIAVFQALEKKANESGPDVYFMQPSYYRELKDNYATTPEEVGTVALVRCKTLQKGIYKGTDNKEYPAMVEDCELTLIDHTKKAVIFKKLFEKTPSQERADRGGFVVTQSSQEDVLQFLKDLPKQ